jgi:probable rRNA maturation factor
LNHRYRGEDKPTNVLAFAAQEAAPSASPARLPERSTLLLGDVVLAYETTVREAKVAGKPVAAHVGHLVVHGVLHLLGYDHQRARDARTMEALEVRALAAIGIADPYEAARPARVLRRDGANRR